MATYFDLSLVPWRVAFNQGDPAYSYPSEQYVAWAEELGVSTTETQVAINGDDLATALTLGYAPVPNANAAAFIASEGGLGLYQSAPGNTTSTAYDLAAQGISRMYGLGTRPNLLLSFHYQTNLKIQNGKVQTRFGVTLIYAELAIYTSGTVRLYVALRIEPGRIEIAARAGTYAVPFILVELNPATNAVVKSTTLLSLSANTAAHFIYDLTNTVGWLASPHAVNAASLVGTVPMAGAILTASFAGMQGLGTVPVAGVARVLTPPVIPALLATVIAPSRAVLTVPWADAVFGRADHAGRWLICTASARNGNESVWGDGVLVRQDHAISWRVRLEAHHNAEWNLPFQILGHRSGWGDYAVVRGQHRGLYSDSPRVSTLLRSPWGNLTTVSRALTHRWGDLTPVVANHDVSWDMASFRGAHLESFWSDSPAATSENVLFWGDGIPPRAALTLPWGNRTQAGRAFNTAWGNGEFPRATLTAPWAETRVHRVAHAAAWTTPVPVRAERATPWDDSAWVRVDLAVGWADLAPLLPVPHRATWSNRPGAMKTLIILWGNGVSLRPDHVATRADRQVVHGHLDSRWGSHPACRWSGEAEWGDTVPVGADLVAGWDDRDTRLAVTHRLVWAERPHARLGLEAPWTDLLPVISSHALTWGESDLRLALAHGLAWGDQALARGHHEISWGAAQAVGTSLGSPWGDRPSGGRVVATGWGDCQPLAPGGHVSVWADRGAGRGIHQARWTEALSARQVHAAPWSDATPARRGLGAAWSDATPSSLTHAAVYADREAAEAGLTAPWGQMANTSRNHVMPWSLTAPARRACTLIWSVNDRPSSAARHRANWAVLEDVNLISIDNVPEVTWQGRSVQILAARLSADEESPVWIAEEIVIAERELWSAIQLGDLIQFSIHEETWLLRVDGKGMSRPRPGDMLLSISAVSPLAWLDAPYASAITLDNTSEAVSARATVAALVAPVGTLTWDLDDWLIPPGALAMSETTPLQAAREIVAAIGGLLESDPDGTPVARRRHPVSVPAYATTTPDQVILDGDLFAFKVAAAPFAGFNRVVITNEDLNGEDARDRLAYFDEDANPYDGEMRAWPHPWRPVTLGHTGHPETVITALGERTHTHTELVEFISGQGQVAYPVHTLTNVTWQHVDLGPLTAQGTALTATVSEPSLAWITYTTRSLDWQVSLQRDEAVQFVLI